MRTLAAFLLLAAPAAAQVTGLVRYQDRVYDGAGFTGAEPFLPVRLAEIEITDPADTVVYATGVTTLTGTFSIAGVPANTPVVARVYARRNGPGINAVVRNNPTGDAVYVVPSAGITTDGAGSGAVPTLDLTIAGGSGPVFNIFDCAIKSMEYQATVDADLPASPPLLLIYWEAGTALGTFFSDTLNAVFLLGLVSDPDQYDDDIILHEIAHWVAEHFSLDQSPGGSHSIIDQLDLRLAWSEGWAHYWSSAVRRIFPGEYAAPGTQVDNFGASNSFFDLEAPSFPALAVMATNELAIAAALWDITDTANEGGFDATSGNEDNVWEAVDDRVPLRTGITLEDFREGLALENPAIMANVTGSAAGPGIMKDREIRYYADASEPNDTSGTATAIPLGGPPVAERTIFPIGDEDWYAVPVGAAGFLTAETQMIGDGGNPLVEIYDPTGTILLASGTTRATAPVSAAGTYLVRILAAAGLAENGYYDVIASYLPPAETVKAGYCGASIADVPRPGWLLLILGLGLLAWRP